MITAEQVKKMGQLTPESLLGLLEENFKILDSEFVGITNGGQFCYDIIIESKYGVKHDKIFVWQDDSGKVVAHRF